jgi:hypothetical protein
MSETPYDPHPPLDAGNKGHHLTHEDQSYRYLPLVGRILDREHIVTLIDSRSRLLTPGIEVMFASDRLAPLLIQDQADQEVLLTWYLHALPPTPRPFLQLGAHLLSRAYICELLEGAIKGDNTLLLRYVSQPDPLMGNAESSIQTLELRGQTADAVRHWLSGQTEVIVPLRLVAASQPSPALGFMQEAPSCPHCESWLTPSVDQTQRTLTLICSLCQYTDGPFTRGDENHTISTNTPTKG